MSLVMWLDLRQEKLVSLVSNCGDFDTGPDITNARSRVYSQIGLD